MSNDGGRVAIRCGYCRRLIREADVDPGGADMCVLGHMTRDGHKPPQEYARQRDMRAPMAARAVAEGQFFRRVGRGADCFDASGGDGFTYPMTRYRFVCRGPRHRDGRVLDRTVRADRLLELCRDALGSPGAGEVVLL